jgi:transposase InsO family protein
MIFFLLLQKNLIKITLLIHFDKIKWLWIDLDEFKEFDFEVIVFHVIKKFSKRTWSIKKNIQFIMFLSRLLIFAEKNYWLIELETVELIWIIKKIKHLIQSFEKSIIIQTNHAAIMNICKQTSIISTNSVMRMNLRLIRVSQFLSQFSNLKIRHKSKKYHLISDALFRLQSLNKENLSDDHAELNELFVDHNVIHAYNTTLMKLSSEFRKRIIDDYFTNESWKKIIHTIDQNEAQSENAAKLFFVRESATVSRESDFYMTSSMKSSLKISVSNHSNNKNLIYHVNRSTEEKRLCISFNCVSDILIIAHEREQDHSGFDICFEIITRFWYIKELIKALRQYIRHCSQCLTIQTRRHKSYENLQSIHSFSVSFHTITMNFVLELSKIKKEIDCVLSIIDKLTKRVMLISEKFIYTAENWAIHLLEETQRRDWNISKVIISDRDRKFLSDLWRTLFARLRISMLYSTAYHSQTNDVSERTNQIMKITLRYYIQELHDSTRWITALWKFQSVFNNTRSAITEKISNELLYEITSNLSLNIFSSNKIVVNHTQLRKEAQNVIDWAQMINKIHYDRRHSSLFLKMNEWVLLRLHHEYFISESKDIIKKIFTQYVRLFKIVQRIERLIYRLNVSSNWKIHSVFIVTQLKSVSDSAKDSFNRSRSTHSSSMTNTQNEYEIERILNKRTVKRDHDFFTKYLIRWLEYESEWDRWYNVKDLDHVKKLIADYEKKLSNSFN